MAKSQETYENISRCKKHKRERMAALEKQREAKIAKYLKKSKREKNKFATITHPLLTPVHKKAPKLLDSYNGLSSKDLV